MFIIQKSQTKWKNTSKADFHSLIADFHSTLVTMCHDSYRRWLPFPFGWCSAVVVTGLLAAADSFLPLLVCLLVTPVVYLLISWALLASRPACSLCRIVLCVLVVHACMSRLFRVGELSFGYSLVPLWFGVFVLSGVCFFTWSVY